MSILEMKVDTLLRLCATEDPQEQKMLRKELLDLMKTRWQTSVDPEYLVRQLLLELIDLGPEGFGFRLLLGGLDLLVCFDQRHTALHRGKAVGIQNQVAGEIHHPIILTAGNQKGQKIRPHHEHRNDNDRRQKGTHTDI